MLRREIIRKAMELGRQRGFVTFNELNELLPPDSIAPEDVEKLFEALNHEGINVTED